VAGVAERLVFSTPTKLLRDQGILKCIPIYPYVSTHVANNMIKSTILVKPNLAFWRRDVGRNIEAETQYTTRSEPRYKRVLFFS